MDCKEHLLALKVMRLTKPSLCAVCPVTTDSKDSFHNYFKKICKMDSSSPCLENFNCGRLLVLPQSFGNIYLGETFSCYMSVHNDSKSTVKNVSVQADLQIGPQKLMLVGCHSESSPISELKPDASVDDVINHEVKEIGTHILACTVSYMNENEERMHFRKFFKFQVLKPLDVKTKFYNAETDEVYLEAQLQNTTASPMCLEKVALEPSANFSSHHLNSAGNVQRLQSIFGCVNCLNPANSRQYLFCLSPKMRTDADQRGAKGVTSIGKLDIMWRTVMGERGRLQTSQLERMAAGCGDVKVSVEDVPAIVKLDKSFVVSCRVSNTCERPLSLKLSLNNRCTTGLLWQGVSGHDIGEIGPGSYIIIHFEAVPIKSGLLVISGISLTDTFLMRTYDYDELDHVFVTSDATCS